jgi:hypothetical protein
MLFPYQRGRWALKAAERGDTAPHHSVEQLAGALDDSKSSGLQQGAPDHSVGRLGASLCNNGTRRLGEHGRW